MVFAQTKIVDDEVQRHRHGKPDQLEQTLFRAANEQVTDQQVVKAERTDVEPEDTRAGRLVLAAALFT